MDGSTARLALPLLHAGQAQKEMSHNEALTLLDLAVHPCVIAAGTEMPPNDPVPGDAWILGAEPQGAWTGHGGAIAGWTAGGWRFLEPFEGMQAWVAEPRLPARFVEGSWRLGDVRAARLTIGGVQVVGARQPAIAAPSGGATVDGEARAVLGRVLAALRTHGLIAPAEL
jgi:hypothetical protein